MVLVSSAALGGPGGHRFARVSEDRLRGDALFRYSGEKIEVEVRMPSNSSGTSALNDVKALAEALDPVAPPGRRSRLTFHRLGFTEPAIQVDGGPALLLRNTYYPTNHGPKFNEPFVAEARQLIQDHYLLTGTEPVLTRLAAIKKALSIRLGAANAEDAKVIRAMIAKIDGAKSKVPTYTLKRQFRRKLNERDLMLDNYWRLKQVEDDYRKWAPELGLDAGVIGYVDEAQRVALIKPVGREFRVFHGADVSFEDFSRRLSLELIHTDWETLASSLHDAHLKLAVSYDTEQVMAPTDHYPGRYRINGRIQVLKDDGTVVESRAFVTKISAREMPYPVNLLRDPAAEWADAFREGMKVDLAQLLEKHPSASVPEAARLGGGASECGVAPVVGRLFGGH